jgi:hypothetical protein
MTVLTKPPRQTTEPCVLHKWCVGRALGNEEHHVVPQAWQIMWFPESNYGEPVMDDSFASHGSAVVSGHYKPKETIWDKRTISCDPLGHRNIHHILVRCMKTYENELWDEGEVETEAMAEEAQQRTIKQMRSEGLHVNTREAFWALEGMWHWLQAGGSLIELCLRHEYGYA